MAVPPAAWPLLGLLWLLAAPSVHCRGDAFQTEEMPEMELSHLDDILDINQELILLEESENSFLIEGDIVRVSPFRMFPFADPRWPKKGGIVQVPYITSYKYDEFSMKRIQEAFLEFEKFTCIKFVPYSSQRDFISITPLSGCFSSIGRTGGMQVVSLVPACLRKGKAVALHELMHVLGFGHEHSRVDRDKYISIAWDEILPGFKMNFMKSRTTNMLVDYDYSSVLHYSRTAFSLRGLPTMVPLSRSCPDLGQRWNLSSSDIARVNRLYSCRGAAAKPATEQAIEGTVTDYVPSELETALPTIKAGLLSAGSPIAPATQVAHPSTESLQQVDTSLPFSTAIEEDFRATEGHSRGTAAPRTEAHDLHVVTQTSSKTEMDEKHLTVTERMPYSPHPKELALESTASISQALQNITSSANQPPHYEGDYTPSRQNNTEKMRQAAPEMALATSPLPTSPEPLATDVAKGTAGRPSKSILHQLLSGTRSMYGEQTEPPTSIAVGSNGTLSLTKGHSFPVMETSTEDQEKAFHTSVSQAGGEVGEHTSMYSVGVGAETPSSPYITPSLKEFGKPTMGLGHEEEHDAQAHAATEVPEDTRLGGKTSSGIILPTASPGSPWKVVMTQEMRTGAETKESGSILPPSETISPPTWMSNSGNLGEENETDHYTESPASSAAWSEPSKLLKGTPESVATSHGRTATMTQDSEPEKVGAFADGRLTTPASVTKEASWKGLDGATTQALLGQRGFASTLLEVRSRAYITSQGVTHTSLGVTQGTTLPLKTGSLESPKFGFPSEGPAATQPPGEMLPHVRSPIGITTSSQAYTPSAAPIEALENQTMAATDGRSGMSTIFKESREPFLDTVGTKLPTETHRSASMATKLARVGSSRLQTEMVHLQGTAWSIPEIRGEATITKFLFQKGTSPILESGVQVPRDPDATDTHLGSQRSTAKSAEMLEAVSTGVGPFLSRYIKGSGEPTATSEKRVASSSVGPNSKWTFL